MCCCSLYQDVSVRRPLHDDDKLFIQKQVDREEEETVREDRRPHLRYALRRSPEFRWFIGLRPRLRIRSVFMRFVRNSYGSMRMVGLWI